MKKMLALMCALSTCPGMTACEPQPNPKLDDLKFLCQGLEEKHKKTVCQ